MAEEASLAHTPTWVVATVCLAIVSISLVAERFLHYLGKVLKHRQQKALFSALQRLKEELMLLGFISFILSLSQGFIVHICIPETATRFMLPCKKEDHRDSTANNKLCKKKDDVPLLSLEALHQLHIFIFVLGLVHVVFCATTILLGGAKMRRWKHWEKEIHREIEKSNTDEFKESSCLNYLLFTSLLCLRWGPNFSPYVRVQPFCVCWLSQTIIFSLPFYSMLTPLYSRFNTLIVPKTEIGRKTKERTEGFCMKLAVVSWTIAFLKQFYDSVSKSDYVALRSAFVSKHYPGRLNFDFHKYMMRAFEHDFKRVVGISWYLWLFVIFFLLLNINGWHTYFWLAFLPLFLLLIVGAKLEHIITRLTQEAETSLSNETECAPKLKPSKEYFWFGKPRYVLHLIHFILFQNSFEIGFFFWIVVSEGFGSCMMERKVFTISRLVIGVAIQVICSYITLPLYAIVTHMSGDIKLQGIGSRIEGPVQSWISGARRTWKKTGDEQDPDPGANVDVTRAPNERFGSPRSMLTPTPSLEEIVAVDDSHGDNLGR